MVGYPERDHLAPLHLPEDEVDDPAPPDVRPRPAAVGEYLRVVAPRVLEGVGEDREAVEGALVVNPPSQGDDGG